MFGSTSGGGGGSSSRPLLYDPGYATMDPVPHNTTAHSNFTPQMTQAYQPAKFAGDEGIPTGARTFSLLAKEEHPLASSLIYIKLACSVYGSVYP